MSDFIESFEIPNQFPIGMRVLAVDHDPTCLQSLHKLLTDCQYQVTTTIQSKWALELVRNNKFDLIIIEIDMPDMDGFKLLELITTLGIDIPVIMLSSKNDQELRVKAITHGAAYYQMKPVDIQIQTICLFTITKHILKNGNCNTKRYSLENEKRVEINNSTTRKHRFVWTTELKNRFAEVVNELGGVDKAQPKMILEKMNDVEGLTSPKIGSYLQKYRINLKRRIDEDNVGNNDSSHIAEMSTSHGFDAPSSTPISAPCSTISSNLPVNGGLTPENPIDNRMFPHVHGNNYNLGNIGNNNNNLCMLAPNHQQGGSSIIRLFSDQISNFGAPRDEFERPLKPNLETNQMVFDQQQRKPTTESLLSNDKTQYGYGQEKQQQSGFRDEDEDDDFFSSIFNHSPN